MRYEDTEFDPATDADREAAAREAELARKIRREVLRVQRGEADDDLRADREAEQEQRAEQERAASAERLQVQFWSWREHLPDIRNQFFLAADPRNEWSSDPGHPRPRVR